MKNQTLFSIFIIFFSTLLLPVNAISTDIRPPDFTFWLVPEGGEISHTLIKGEQYFLTARVDWHQEKHDYAVEYGVIYFAS